MSHDSATSSSAAFFGRLAWIILGPMALAVLTMALAQNPDGWFAPTDLVFLLVLGLMLLGRWAEFRSGGAKTTEGELATQEQVRRYYVVAPLVGMGLWVLANLIGNQGWSR
jgi:hypothetical protein